MEILMEESIKEEPREVPHFFLTFQDNLLPGKQSEAETAGN